MGYFKVAMFLIAWRAYVMGRPSHLERTPMIRIYALLLTLSLISIGGTAHAEITPAVANCTIGDPAIQANRYLITGGSISYQSAATGLITIYCPIYGLWVSTSPPANFKITYADTDSTQPGNTNITAQIIKLSRANGGLTVVLNGIDSNSQSGTSGGVLTHTLSGITWDFANYYYYVRFDLNRTSATTFSTLFGYILE